MSRGHYQPLDRDRHWALGWGYDEAIGVARDQTIGEAARAVLPAASAAGKIVRGGRGVWRGSQAFQDRGEVPIERVGAAWFHSPSDRQQAIARLDAGFQALVDDLAIAVPERGRETDARWLAIEVTPTLREWRAFADRGAGSWWARAATDWNAFEDWEHRLRRLRELARARDIKLTSPDPLPLPKTVWELGASGQGSEAAAWLGVLKLAVMAGIGITGFVTLYAVLRDMRKGDERTARPHV